MANTLESLMKQQKEISERIAKEQEKIFNATGKVVVECLGYLSNVKAFREFLVSHKQEILVSQKKEEK